MLQRYPRRSQYEYAKKPYRIRDWPEYETGLRRRGELTLWICEDAAQAWHAPRGLKPGGQPVLLGPGPIEAALTILSVYGLGLQQTEGFLKSVCMLLGLSIRIPDHSTLFRRSQELETVRLCDRS